MKQKHRTKFYEKYPKNEDQGHNSASKEENINALILLGNTTKNPRNAQPPSTPGRKKKGEQEIYIPGRFLRSAGSLNDVGTTADKSTARAPHENGPKIKK